MAKKSAAERTDTHLKVLQQASKAFRKQGSGVAINDVMKQIGMTPGGFYRHFDSKEDLLVDAIALALREIADRLDEVARRAEKGKELEAIVTAYLSSEHLLHPESWCAMAALGPDISRLPAAIRKRLGEAMQYYSERLSPFMPGANRDEQGRNFLILFSAMAGAIMMLRVLPDPAAQEQMLGMVRNYYLATFAQSSKH